MHIWCRRTHICCRRKRLGLAAQTFFRTLQNRKTKTQKRKRAILKGVIHTDKFILIMNYRYRSKMMMKVKISTGLSKICPICLVDELKIIAKLIKFNLFLKGEGFGGGRRK